jgi:hypothetical protein
MQVTMLTVDVSLTNLVQNPGAAEPQADAADSLYPIDFSKELDAALSKIRGLEGDAGIVALSGKEHAPDPAPSPVQEGEVPMQYLPDLRAAERLDEAIVAGRALLAPLGGDDVAAQLLRLSSPAVESLGMDVTDFTPEDRMSLDGGGEEQSDSSDAVSGVPSQEAFFRPATDDVLEERSAIERRLSKTPFDHALNVFTSAPTIDEVGGSPTSPTVAPRSAPLTGSPSQSESPPAPISTTETALTLNDAGRYIGFATGSNISTMEPDSAQPLQRSGGEIPGFDHVGSQSPPGAQPVSSLAQPAPELPVTAPLVPMMTESQSAPSGDLQRDGMAPSKSTPIITDYGRDNFPSPIMRDRNAAMIVDALNDSLGLVDQGAKDSARLSTSVSIDSISEIQEETDDNHRDKHSLDRTTEIAGVSPLVIPIAQVMAPRVDAIRETSSAAEFRLDGVSVRAMAQVSTSDGILPPKLFDATSQVSPRSEINSASSLSTLNGDTAIRMTQAAASFSNGTLNTSASASAAVDPTASFEASRATPSGVSSAVAGGSEGAYSQNSLEVTAGSTVVDNANGSEQGNSSSEMFSAPDINRLPGIDEVATRSRADHTQRSVDDSAKPRSQSLGAVSEAGQQPPTSPLLKADLPLASLNSEPVATIKVDASDFVGSVNNVLPTVTDTALQTRLSKSLTAREFDLANRVGEGKRVDRSVMASGSALPSADLSGVTRDSRSRAVTVSNSSISSVSRADHDNQLRDNKRPDQSKSVGSVKSNRVVQPDVNQVVYSRDSGSETTLSSEYPKELVIDDLSVTEPVVSIEASDSAVAVSDGNKAPITTVSTKGADTAGPSGWQPIRQFAVEVIELAQNGGGRIKLKLTPPEKGELEISLSIDAIGRAHLAVSGAEGVVRDRLESTADSLQKQFSQMGLSLAMDLNSGATRQDRGDSRGEGRSDGFPTPNPYSQTSPSVRSSQRLSPADSGALHLIA